VRLCILPHDRTRTACSHAGGRRPSDTEQHSWSVRVRSARPGETARSLGYARGVSFPFGDSASFREVDPLPSLVEQQLGLVGADLVAGLTSLAARRGIPIDAVEVSVTGTLENPLVHIGVVGEEGHAGFDLIDATVYVATDVDEEILQPLWDEVLRRAPIVNTLSRAARVTLSLKVVL
jgi:hypothetical protein